MTHHRAVGIAMAALLVLGCARAAGSPAPDASGSAARASAGGAATNAAGSPTTNPAPKWDRFEVGELQFDGAFDKPYGEAVSGVAFGGGFVLVGRSHEPNDQPRGAVWTSPDAEAWTRHLDPDGTFDGMYLGEIATDGRRLVVLGWRSPWTEGRRNAYVAWTSDNGGATWARHEDLESTDLGAIYADGIVGSPAGAGFLAWGAPPEDGHTRLLWSPDGLAWHRLEYPGSDDNDIRHVAPLDAGFVAVGGGHWDGQVPPREDARAWFSADGQAWEAADLPGAEHTMWTAYPFAGGVYAIGQSHFGGVDPPMTWLSVDGRRWRALGSEPGHASFTASNGTQVARFAWQDGRSVSVSNDGIEWRTVVDAVPAVEWDGQVLFGRDGILLVAALLPHENGVQYVHTGVLYLRGVRT